MSADALLPAEVRPPRHCRRCGHPVPKGPLIDGLGVECATMLGLLPGSARVHGGGGQDGPDLFNHKERDAIIETLEQAACRLRTDAEDLAVRVASQRRQPDEESPSNRALRGRVNETTEDVRNDRA